MMLTVAMYLIELKNYILNQYITIVWSKNSSYLIALWWGGGTNRTHINKLVPM